MQPSQTGSPRWAGPVALVVGLLLAQGVIYLATGWRDGFQQPGLWALKRIYLRALPWSLPLAAAVGWLLQWFHRRWLEKDPDQPLSGWSVLLAILRLFLHFPFYGFLVLIQFVYLLLAGLGKGLTALLLRRKSTGPTPPLDFMNSTALWMLMGPLTGMKDDTGKTLRFDFTRWDFPYRAVRLFPWLLLVLWVWTGAESEETGERVHPFLLSLAAMVWMGDFLLLTWLNRPAWLRKIQDRSGN